jgi:hypothetical protein
MPFVADVIAASQVNRRNSAFQPARPPRNVVTLARVIPPGRLTQSPVLRRIARGG